MAGLCPGSASIECCVLSGGRTLADLSPPSNPVNGASPDTAALIGGLVGGVLALAGLVLAAFILVRFLRPKSPLPPSASTFSLRTTSTDVNMSSIY